MINFKEALLESSNNIIKRIQCTLDGLPNSDPDYGYVLYNKKDNHLWVVIGDANEEPREWQDKLSSIPGIDKFSYGDEALPPDYKYDPKDSSWIKIKKSSKSKSFKESLSFTSLLESDSLLRSIYYKLLSDIDMEFWYSFSDELEQYDESLALIIRNCLPISQNDFSSLDNELNKYYSLTSWWYENELQITRDRDSNPYTYMFNLDTSSYEEWHYHYNYYYRIENNAVPTDILRYTILEILSSRAATL